MTIVCLEGPRGFASPRCVPVLSIPGEVIVDFGDRRFFSEFCFERATIFYPLRACDHYRLYIALAAASARAHPVRFPRASSRLARAKVAANFAFARCSALLIELGVGWRSICAAIDWRAIGPAFGFPADCRTASSNCAISALQGPACADPMLRPKAEMKKAAAIRGLIDVLLTFGCRVGVRSSSVPSISPGKRDSEVPAPLQIKVGKRGSDFLLVRIHARMLPSEGHRVEPVEPRMRADRDFSQRSPRTTLSARVDRRGALRADRKFPLLRIVQDYFDRVLALRDVWSCLLKLGNFITWQILSLSITPPDAVDLGLEDLAGIEVERHLDG